MLLLISHSMSSNVHEEQCALAVATDFTEFSLYCFDVFVEVINCFIFDFDDVLLSDAEPIGDLGGVDSILLREVEVSTFLAA